LTCLIENDSGPTDAASVVDVFQRVGKWLGMPKETWKGSTGHSARVGVTQDLVARGWGICRLRRRGGGRIPECRSDMESDHLQNKAQLLG
jgi:hypothetical protein